MADPLAILLAERLVLWWEAADPELRMGRDSVHDLAGIVMLANHFLAQAEKELLAEKATEPGAPEPSGRC